MRQLTVKQKKILDAVIRENTGVACWDDLPTEVIEELESINDTEILWSEVNRYMSDKKYEI